MKKIKTNIEYEYEPFIEVGEDETEKLKKIKEEEEAHLEEMKDYFQRSNRFKPSYFKFKTKIS